MSRSLIRVGVLPMLGLFEVAKIPDAPDNEVKITGGYESLFLDSMLQYLGRPYKTFAPGKTTWGLRHADGNWSALMGMVQRGEVDMAVGSVFLTPDRQEDFDVSAPYSLLTLNFATKQPEKVYPAYTLVYPFNPTFWLCLVALLVVMPFVMRHMLSRRIELGSLFFSVLGSFVGQSSNNLQSDVLRDRLLVVSLSISAFFTSLIYSSVLLSFLTIPMTERGVRDLPQLARAVSEGRMKCFIIEGKSSIDHILRTEDSSLRSIFESIKENGWDLEADPDLLRKVVFGQKHAVISTYIHLRLYLGDDVFVSEDSFYLFHAVVVLRKNSRWTRRVNEAVKRIPATGLYWRNFDAYLHRRMVKAKMTRTGTEDGPLRKMALQNVSGAFVLLGIGHAVSAVVLVIEVMVGRRQMKQPIFEPTRKNRKSRRRD